MNRLSTTFLMLLLTLLVLPQQGFATRIEMRVPGAHTKGRAFARTVYTPLPAQSQVTFGVSYQRFLDLYAVGNTVEVHHKIPEADYNPDYVYQMDVGVTDLSEARTFTMPEIAFDGVWRYVIMAPEDTPYAADIPGATHVLVEQFDDPSEGFAWYEYYQIDETGITVLAYVGEYDGETEFMPIGFPLAAFPLDETLSLFHEEQYYDEDFEQEVLNDQTVEMHGYGTFVLDEESIPAGIFINDVNWRDPAETDPNTVLDFETYYSIFGEDGTWMSFYVAPEFEEQSEIAYMGEIFFDTIELWRVTPQSTNVEDDQASVIKDYRLSAAYPNPFNPQTRFTLELAETQAVTVSVYDLLGRRVAQLHDGVLAGQTAHGFTFEASGLPSGTYLIQAQGARFQQSQLVTLLK